MPNKNAGSKSAENTLLIPLSEFKETLKNVLNVSKEQSDKQIAELQTSNAQTGKTRGPKKRKRKD